MSNKTTGEYDGNGGFYLVGDSDGNEIITPRFKGGYIHDPLSFRLGSGDDGTYWLPTAVIEYLESKTGRSFPDDLEEESDGEVSQETDSD